MKAQFLQQQPGTAQLTLALEGQAVGNAPCSLVVQRSSDQCFMGQGGMGAWTLKEEDVSLPCERGNDTLVFQLGPEYVNYLEPGNYQIRLRVGGEEVGKARVKIDNVQTQALGGSGAMQAQPGREALAAPAAPVTPAVESQAEAEVTLASEQASVPQAEQALAMQAAPDKPKGKLPLLLVALLALCLAGSAGYYFYQQNESAAQAEAERLAAEEAAKKAEAEQREAAARAEQERLAAEAARKAEEERLAAEVAAKAEQEHKAAEDAAHRADARGRARAFFASEDKTPKGAYTLTQEVDTTTDEQKDAVFRLLYYAASGNYTPAYMAYAACLDPTTEKWGTLEKDPPEAWTYYRKAGTDEGTAAANRVLDWVKQQPPTNAKAREWLQMMQQ